MSVPALGPVVRGGKTVLEHALTHHTGGLDGFPAFDDGWKAGRVVLAPERLTVTRIGRARRRDGRPNGRSVHATGRSGIRYWFGHVDDVPAVGAVVWKGRRLARISANHEVPHVHVGIDARPLIGRELRHRHDYKLGATPIGKQLRAALGGV